MLIFRALLFLCQLSLWPTFEPSLAIMIRLLLLSAFLLVTIGCTDASPGFTSSGNTWVGDPGQSILRVAFYQDEGGTVRALLVTQQGLDGKTSSSSKIYQAQDSGEWLFEVEGSSFGVGDDLCLIALANTKVPQRLAVARADISHFLTKLADGSYKREDVEVFWREVITPRLYK